MARKRKKRNAGKRASDKRNKRRAKLQTKNAFIRSRPPGQCKREIRQKLKHLFGGCCRLCGYDRTFKALEFHHVNSKQKEYSVSKMVAVAGYKGALQEAMKCILVCANCHREVEDGLLPVPRRVVREQMALVWDNLEKEIQERSWQTA